MQPTSLEPVAAPGPRRRALDLGAAGLATLAGLLLAPFASTVRHPPVFYPEWLLVGGIAVGAIALCFRGSAAKETGGATRVLLGGMILLNLVSLAIPLQAYYATYHDYPWLVLTALLLVGILGGRHARQGWLALGLPIFASYWFHGAMQPPALGVLPVSQTQGDCTVTVRSLDRDSYRLVLGFDVRWKPAAGREPYDLENVRVEGRVPPLLPVRCWRARPWPEEDDSTPQEVALSAMTFPPVWTRSVDFTVSVPAWPPEPATFLTLPVPPPGTPISDRTWSSEGGDIRLSAGKLRWNEGLTPDPAGSELAAQITYGGYRYSGGTGQELRVLDEQGRRIPIRHNSMTGDGSSTTLEAQLGPIPAGTKQIRLEAFSEAQRKQHRKMFHFRGLPNRSVP